MRRPGPSAWDGEPAVKCYGESCGRGAGAAGFLGAGMKVEDVMKVWRSSLRTKVVLLTLAVFLAVAAPAYFAFEWIVHTTVVKLGTLFAEKQILYDRYRGLEALMREVSLAEMLARSPVLREWAADEDNPEKRVRGLKELEHFRLAFKDRSYFFVSHATGNYYFNDRDNSYGATPLRYRVSPSNPRDGWYYKTIANGKGCHLNVDHDDNLAVTKVWMNCVIEENGRILGAAGSGIDLTEFIRDVVDLKQLGVQSVFVDRSGAIQAHQDTRMVDFHSLTKDLKNKKTIFLLIDDPADRANLQRMMAEVRDGRHTVQSAFMRIGGRQFLVGVGFLDALGWFNVALMDIDQIIDRRLFLPIGSLLAAMMAAAVALLTYLFKRSVIDRLGRLEGGVRRVEGGEFKAPLADAGSDEIGRLARAFASMADTVGNHTQILEREVCERTRELREIAEVDPLTGIFNRRGFLGAAARRRAGAGTCGLLLIDMDMFKTINDAFGHQSGDIVLTDAARRLEQAAGHEAVCARWGGDEFIVFVPAGDAQALQAFAGELTSAITKDPVQLRIGAAIRLTLSIGGTLLGPEQSIDSAIAEADVALYAVKQNGRDDAVIYDRAVHGEPGWALRRPA